MQNDNNINYEEILCKQNFIVQDKFQQNSMSFIKENNHSNILLIQIKENRKSSMINDQQIPILIEKKIHTNNMTNLMLHQDWKIYPRLNRTHLNLDFFLRKQSTLHFLNACLLMLKILDVMQIRSYIYIYLLMIDQHRA